jgi:dihydroorotate dehydrogenase (NAD+) catalytic subunit
VQAVKIPVIGLGGIRTAEDALEFLLVGARAVQVGTANFLRPTAALEIIRGIEEFMINKRIAKVGHFSGSLQPCKEAQGLQ